MSSETNNAAETKMHKFEAAGMGKAPFTYIGFEEKFVVDGVGENATTRPGASCQYCFTAIRNVFHIRSADGKLSHVGCDCIAKVGDAGLKKVVAAVVADHKKSAKAEKDAARIAAGIAAFAADSEQMAALPHPNSYHAANGKTLADYVAWMLENAGTSGKLAACRMIEKAGK